VTRTRAGKGPDQWGLWSRITAAPPAAYTNGLLVVTAEIEIGKDNTPMMHLVYRRADGKPIPWAQAQRMKSELCGADTEGVELYPSETRAIEGATAHLYVLPPGLGFNFGVDVARTDRLRFPVPVLPRAFPAWAGHVKALQTTRLNPKAAPTKKAAEGAQ
jgi:hypothetical protein